MLKTETDSPEIRKEIQEVAENWCDCWGHICSVHFEHGQHWVTCECGASWSVCDAVSDDAHNGFILERIDQGDEEYHLHVF